MVHQRVRIPRQQMTAAQRGIADVFDRTEARLGHAPVTLDDLTHADQERLTALLAQHRRDARRRSAVRVSAGKVTVSARNTGTQADADPMLFDDDVWAAVVGIEQMIGLRATGSRQARYDAVCDELAKIRKRGVKRPESIPEHTYQLVKRCRGLLDRKIGRYHERREESARVQGDLARQAAAVLTASKMSRR